MVAEAVSIMRQIKALRTEWSESAAIYFTASSRANSEMGRMVARARAGIFQECEEQLAALTPVEASEGKTI